MSIMQGAWPLHNPKSLTENRFIYEKISPVVFLSLHLNMIH